MEATLIRERVIAGLIAARNNGVKLGRPSPTKKIDAAITLYIESDLTVNQISENCDISTPTVTE